MSVQGPGTSQGANGVHKHHGHHKKAGEQPGAPPPAGFDPSKPPIPLN